MVQQYIFSMQTLIGLRINVSIISYLAVKFYILNIFLITSSVYGLVRVSMSLLTLIILSCIEVYIIVVFNKNKLAIGSSSKF